jgi:hypothetical protein
MTPKVTAIITRTHIYVDKSAFIDIGFYKFV